MSEGAASVEAEIAVLLTAAGVLADGKWLERRFTSKDLANFVDLYNNKSPKTLSMLNRKNKKLASVDAIKTLNRVLNAIGMKTKGQKTTVNKKNDETI